MTGYYSVSYLPLECYSLFVVRTITRDNAYCVYEQSLFPTKAIKCMQRESRHSLYIPILLRHVSCILPTHQRCAFRRTSAVCSDTPALVRHDTPALCLPRVWHSFTARQWHVISAHECACQRRRIICVITAKCVAARTHAYTHACIHACTDARMYACTDAHVCGRTNVWTHARTYVRTHAYTRLCNARTCEI